MPSSNHHIDGPPHDLPSLRRDEIASWLQERVSPDQVVASLDSFDAIVAKPALVGRLLECLLLLVTGIWIVCLYYRIVNGPRIASSEQFRNWLVNHDLSSSELWTYDTGGDSWENLHGECGYAIVKNGVVVDFWMWLMN